LSISSRASAFFVPHPPAWLEELVDEVTIAATAVETLAMTMVRDLARRASTLDFGMEE
jgi:hypothetical protein